MSGAERFEVAVVGARFAGEARIDSGAQDAPKANPTPKPAASESVREPSAEASSAAAEKAGENDNRQQSVGEGDRVPARALNPEGAPIVIAAAWTPRHPPAPSSNETERAMDRGHRLTRTPALALVNQSTREVLRVRLRFKADRESHAVTLVEEPITPGETLRLPPGRSMWGRPEAMTVQVLGVAFVDGGTWGSMDSTIDTREGWIR